MLNPCQDDPAEFFDFEDEWLVCRAENIRARQTRDVCGLNREELRGERKKVLTLIEAVAKTFLFVTDDNHKRYLAQTLQKVIQPSANYAAMAKVKLARLGITLDHLEMTADP